MENLKVANVKDFEKQIKNFGDDQVIVDFWATWCPPCRMMSPILDTMDKERKVTVVKVDVDENPEVAQAFGIQSIPTMMFFKHGAPNRRNLVGVVPVDALKAHIS